MNKKRFIRSRRAGFAVGAAVALTVAAASAFAVTGKNVYIPELGRSVPAEKASAIQHSLPRSAPESKQRAPEPAPDTTGISARLLGPEAPVPVSPIVLRTVNGWVVADGRTLVSVYAGAAGNDTSEGRIVIIRQNLQAGEQTQKVVDAGSTGALRISDAPLGAAVETSAQQGNLLLRDAHGGIHVLHLASDAITSN